jgi:hypothetical protein
MRRRGQIGGKASGDIFWGTIFVKTVYRYKWKLSLGESPLILDIESNKSN